MKTLTVLALMLATPLAAAAQDAIPQLKGTWKGTGKILLFGTTEHLSGSPQNAVVRDLEVTHTVTGQDGRLIWGTTSSANNDSKEPFAWALSADNKTILGADTDGYYRITIMSADRIEKCYAQSATGPRHAIVATCFMMNSGQELEHVPFDSMQNIQRTRCAPLPTKPGPARVSCLSAQVGQARLVVGRGWGWGSRD